MFGGKKAKETQSQIQYLEKVQSEYHHIIEYIRKTNEVSDEAFSVLKVQDAQLEQSLNGIVDVLKDSKKDSGKYAIQLEQIAEKLKEVSDLEENRKKVAEHQSRMAETGKQTVAQIEELSELCEQTKKVEQESREVKTQTMEQSFAELEKMQETAKNMSTLALNAAIEAGRLGQSGIGFLQAAEEVRKLSEEYVKMTENLVEQLSEMQKIQGESDLADSLTKISDKVKETELLTDALKNDVMPQMSDASDVIKEQREAVSQISSGIRQAEDRYQRVLDQMELIEQNNIEGKKAREGLEEQLADIYRKIV